jgi:microcystin-dependent protein
MLNGTISLNKRLIAGMIAACSLSAPATLHAQDGILGEVRLFAVIYCPGNWLETDGRTLQIADNPALFSLLSNRFGGDGKETFRLPDLRGRVAIGAGHAPGLSRYEMGQSGGTESVALEVQEMPAHSHAVSASAKAGTSPASLVTGAEGEAEVITEAVHAAGMSQPHENRPPYQVVRYCICVRGSYPQRP